MIGRRERPFDDGRGGWWREYPAVFQTLGQGVAVVIALRDAAGYAGIEVLRWS